MKRKFDFPEQGKTIAYVKAIDPSLLTEEIAEQMDAGSPIYAVLDEDSMPLALTQNRGMAFALARQNDLAPHSVH